MIKNKAHSALSALINLSADISIVVSHLAPGYQRIAKKSNVVSDASDLIVKNEGNYVHVQSIQFHPIPD
jgi:hypothetical protein